MDQPNSSRPARGPSSTSSLYLSGTLFSPDIAAINASIATLLYTRITDDPAISTALLANKDLSFFSEERYIKIRPDTFTEERRQLLRSPPKRQDVYDFIDALYERTRCRFRGYA